MKAEFYLLILLSMPTFAQRATGVDYNLSADYKKYTNLKKAGVAGIVVFGTTWLAGNVVASLGMDLGQQGLSLSLTF